MDEYNHTWYNPGDWKLPGWWTNGPPGRDGRATYEEQVGFYGSEFVQKTLGHRGGMTSPPQVEQPRSWLYDLI